MVLHWHLLPGRLFHSATRIALQCGPNRKPPRLPDVHAQLISRGFGYEATRQNDFKMLTKRPDPFATGSCDGRDRLRVGHIRSKSERGVPSYSRPAKLKCFGRLHANHRTSPCGKMGDGFHRARMWKCAHFGRICFKSGKLLGHEIRNVYKPVWREWRQR